MLKTALSGLWGVFFVFALLCGLLGGAPEGRKSSGAVSTQGGWGVDACLSVHVPAEEVADYLALLKSSGVRWLRERATGFPVNEQTGADFSFPGRPRPRTWKQLREAGFLVDAFAGPADNIRPTHPHSQLPEDLMAVYHSARLLPKVTGGMASAWELAGEPDTAYCRDLPDRVVAYDKAVYLGIKDGARDLAAGSRGGSAEPGVLMGALGYAPGPWLDRAARNGLFDYTDGLNFHFYGLAGDLAGVIKAQRKFASRFVTDRRLPVWITECGINAVPRDDFEDRHGREMQRQFTMETAGIALENNVSVFMPFLLVGDDNPHALVEFADSPYPAWTGYAALTRERSLPAGPAFAPPESPCRVVMQWLPDDATCIPQKVSGTYWFDRKAGGRKVIEGEIVIYNFSSSATRGSLELRPAPGLRMDGGGVTFPREVEIPRFGSVRIPLSFTADAKLYLRAEVDAVFRPQPGGGEDSRLMFALETRPSDALLAHVFPLTGHRPEASSFAWIWGAEKYEVSSRAGPWLAVNEAQVSGPAGPDLGAGWSFRVENSQDNPLLPPMAVTAVDGLPEVRDGFLRLRMPATQAKRMRVRVDLVDKRGQRFAIAENMGRNWIAPDDAETFLSYRDFHLYAWGRCTEDPVFRPADIREIQLRFYSDLPPRPAEVRLDVVAPRDDNPYEHSHPGS